MTRAKTPKNRLIAVLSIIFFVLSLMNPLTGTIAAAESGTELTNVALNKPITSSDGDEFNPEYPPSQAVDGIGLVHANGWDSKSSLVMSGAWLQIDLQDEHVISRVEIDDRKSTNPAEDEWDGPRKNFEIRASNDFDFNDYIVLGGIGNDATEFPNNTTWVLDVEDANAYRYIRFVKTIKDYQFLSEIRVFSVLPDGGQEPEEPQDPGEITEFYVSPDGDDSNDGSIDSPFATIEKARDIIRGINSDMKGNIIVYLRGGEYDISNVIEFDQRDSGTNGYRIIYTNYPGENPVLTSAKSIAGWTEEDDIFKTNVGNLKFRDLYINGQRGMRARTESYSISAWNTAGRTFNIDSSAFEGWEGIELEKVEAVLNTHWTESYTRMASYTINGSVAAVRLSAAGEPIFTRSNPDRAVNQGVHFENAYEFLDKPGEWFLNEDNGDLFYIPREGETLSNIDAKVGTIETFVNIKGKLNDTVKNIVIHGIIFEYTTFNNPIVNNGVIFSQGGFVRNTGEGDLGGGRQPAAIYLEGADNIKLERNVFRHLGATAIDIKYMAHNNEVVGNALTDIAGNGIMVGVFNDTPAGYSHTNPLTLAQNNVISNNYLRGIGADHYCGTGIILGYTNGTIVEHNEISNVSYTAIASGWGWTANSTCLGNTKINYNNLYNYMTGQSDGAGIYTLSKTPNSEIAGNYIHDDDRNQFASSYPIAAIYLDEQSEGYNVHDNVSNRVGVKLNLNKIKDGANILSNNDSQDEAIKANAGLQPEYWDIVPEAFRQATSADWAADTYGGVRISGTVSISDPAYSEAYTASIYKNDNIVWGPTPVGITPGTSYNICIDVLPNDVVSFVAEDDNGSVVDSVYWDSFIKPEIYIPRLVISTFTHSDQTEPAEISDRTKKVTLKVKSGTDITDFHPEIITPPGTVLVHESETIPTDYSKPVKMRVYMEEGSEFLGFDGGRKYKEWEVTVLVESEAVFVKGYNIGEQIADSDNWYVSAGSATTGINSLKFAAGGYSIYRAKEFTDELLEFNMNTSASGWPSITFRNQSDIADGIGSNSSCYITVIKPDVIELQRFNKGKRVPLYITGVGEDAPLIGDAIPNTFFNHGGDNLVQVGAMNTDAGVRLVMYINGKKVFDCIDQWDGKITEPGYFGTYQAAGSITLSKAPAVTSLNDVIADTDNWYISKGDAAAGTNSITLEEGYAIYQGQQFQDELLELTMNTAALGWPSITFRNQSSTADGIGSDSSCYITVIKPDVIELQRFNKGKRVPLYITGIGEDAPLIGDAIQNTFFVHGEDNLVQMGAMNTDAGVRLIMYINGLKVFDCIDEWDGKITEPGYFGTYQASAPIVLSKTPESTSLADIISDTDNWYTSEGAAIAGTNSITFDQGYAIYKGRQFEEEMLEFYMNTTALGWPSITFRNQSSTAEGIGPDSSCYITVIKPDVIELQRFNKGKRVPLYITGIGEDAPLIGDAIQNTFFVHGEDNLVQLGSMNTDAGVRLVMYINGKKVFDCIDEWDGKITEPGYFGTYQASAPIKLSKRFDLEGAVGKFSLLDFEIAKVIDIIDTAPIGTEEGEYALWAKEYLEIVLADTQKFRQDVDESVPQGDVNAALNKLKTAKAVFDKSKNEMTNIALGKTVTSSDGENVFIGHEPSKLVDGTVAANNGWSPMSYDTINAWAQIDLGSVSTINRVVVVDRPGTDSNGTWYGERRNFEIQASNNPDFETYVVLGAVGEEPFPDNTPTGWVLNVPEGTKYRYIRYQKTEQIYFYISEIRVLGAVAPDTYNVNGTVSDDSQQPIEGVNVNLYSFDDHNTVLGTATTAADGSYTIDTTQVAGKYVVKAEKADIGEGNSILYIPFADVSNADIVLTKGGESKQFTIGTPVFKDANGNIMTHLTASTDLRASIEVTNNSEESANACFIVALYGPGPVFKTYSAGEGIINGGQTVTFNSYFPLPDDVTGHYVKVFVWDSLEGMIPISNAITFK